MDGWMDGWFNYAFPVMTGSFRSRSKWVATIFDRKETLASFLSFRALNELELPTSFRNIYINFSLIFGKICFNWNPGKISYPHGQVCKRKVLKDYLSFFQERSFDLSGKRLNQKRVQNFAIWFVKAVMDVKKKRALFFFYKSRAILTV